MKRTDLHMHTTASDGSYQPQELIKKCAEAKLEWIAITDHDTTAGIEEAKSAAADYGMNVINGIELSCVHNGKSVHMLGYGIDPSSKRLQNELKNQQWMRQERLTHMLTQLKMEGISLEEEEVYTYSSNKNVGRPHLAKALLNKGYVRSVKEAFDLYLAEGKKGYVPKPKEFTPEEAMELIEVSGGLSVIAHPKDYNLDAMIHSWLVTEKLAGIEIWHREHDKKTVKRFEQLADIAEQESGRPVIRTGGSDFHHEAHGSIPLHLGEVTISNQYAEQLQKRISTAQT